MTEENRFCDVCYLSINPEQVLSTWAFYDEMLTEYLFCTQRCKSVKIEQIQQRVRNAEAELLDWTRRKKDYQNLLQALTNTPRY